MSIFKKPQPRLDAPVSTDRTPTPLAAAEQPSRRIMSIDRPGATYPVDHSVSTVDPHLQADEYRADIRSSVAAAAANGGFDQENLEMLSHYISSLLEEWNTRAHQVSHRRLETAEMLVAQAAQNLKGGMRELATLQERRAEKVAARDELLTSQFGFSPSMLVDTVKVRADATALAAADRSAAEDGTDASVVLRLRAERTARRRASGTPPVKPLLPLTLPPSAAESTLPPARPATGFAASAEANEAPSGPVAR